jgi:hypothetical protein
VPAAKGEQSDRAHCFGYNALVVRAGKGRESLRKEMFNIKELDMAETPGNAPQGPSAEELKQAFKAFKKRLKLTRLDEESRLSKSPLSKGPSGIVAISPPNQFSQAVWDELVRQGKLKKMPGGTYGLAQE